MLRKKLFINIIGIILYLSSNIFGFEINTTLMHYTYRIVGPTGEPNQLLVGTAFMMGIPDKNIPEKGHFVMVTAAHLLEGIAGETAIIDLREKTADGKYKKRTHTIQIRNRKEPIWVRHPTVDVAVMKIDLPSFVSKLNEEIPLLSTDLLADDEMIEKYEIHPGDELLCLGYPHAKNANIYGFSILRSGKIASYPLTPANEIKSFLYDREIFPGNSGGPVYFVDKSRSYGGNIHLGKTIQFVAGLITKNNEELHLAIVVPAHFIKETLLLLDEK